MHNIAEALWPLMVEIDLIKPDSCNARQHPERNREALKRSLEEYGQRKPVVVNGKTGIIEAGNGLWHAAKALGWGQIAVAMVEDGEEMAAGYALMDNQSALLSEWDLPTLKDLLSDLDTGAFDMSLTGFDEKEIEGLMTQYHPTEADLPTPMPAPDFEGLDTRGDYLLLACDDKVGRSFWLGRLGIKEFPDRKRIITAKDIRE